MATGGFMATMAGVNKLAAGKGLMTFTNFAAGMGLYAGLVMLQGIISE